MRSGPTVAELAGGDSARSSQPVLDQPAGAEDDRATAGDTCAGTDRRRRVACQGLAEDDA